MGAVALAAADSDDNFGPIVLNRPARFNPRQAEPPATAAATIGDHHCRVCARSGREVALFDTALGPVCEKDLDRGRRNRESGGYVDPSTLGDYNNDPGIVAQLADLHPREVLRLANRAADRLADRNALPPGVLALFRDAFRIAFRYAPDPDYFVDGLGRRCCVVCRKVLTGKQRKYCGPECKEADRPRRQRKR